MQNVYISPGKALCRFCGTLVSMNQLSNHIAREHPRPKRDMAPTLVSKKREKAKPPSK